MDTLSRGSPENPGGVFDGFDLRGPGWWRGFCEAFALRELECLQVEVTSYCPGHCTYCPHTTEGANWRSTHMSPEIFAGLWPLMRRCSRVHLQGWGEPLLHPHFFEFVELALRAGCRVSTTSCGLRMDDELAVRLVDSGIDLMAFSLAGTDDASNASRAGVPFRCVEQAVATLQRVRKARMGVHLEIHLAYLLLYSGIPALKDLSALMERWDVHGAVVSTMDFIAHPSLAAEAFMPHEREKIAESRAALQSLSVSRPLHYALPAEMPAPQCRERVQSTLYVSAEGFISPCVYLNVPSKLAGRRLIFGKIPDESITDIWNRPDYVAFRQTVGTSAPHAACQNCPKRFEQVDE